MSYKTVLHILARILKIRVLQIKNYAINLVNHARYTFVKL